MEKIKKEFPELEYDKEAKPIGDVIFYALDELIDEQQSKFDSL